MTNLHNELQQAVADFEGQFDFVDSDSVAFLVLQAVQRIAYRYLNDEDYFWEYQQTSANDAAGFLYSIADQYNIDSIVDWLRCNTEVIYGVEQIIDLLNITYMAVQNPQLNVYTERDWLDKISQQTAREMFGEYAPQWDDEDQYDEDQYEEDEEE